LQLSAAVFPDIDQSRSLKAQDWASWGQQHWLDFISPMTLTGSIPAVGDNTQAMMTELNQACPVITGIFGPFEHMSEDTTLAQINAARKAGANGAILFETAHFTPELWQALALANQTELMPQQTSESPEHVVSNTSYRRHRRGYTHQHFRIRRNHRRY
jgi:hypothetical protein